MDRLSVCRSLREKADYTDVASSVGQLSDKAHYLG